MFQVFRIKPSSDGWYNYYLRNDEHQLGIIFCDNGDLYFSSFDKAQESIFLITKENMVIYNLFNQLFVAFEAATVFTVSQSDLLRCNNFQEKQKIYEQVYERNQRLKETDIYAKVYHDQKITWISDDSISFDYQSADSLTIIKEPDCFRLKFAFYEDEFPHVRSIRIRNARSRYKPFNMLMMDFFNDLQNYDPNFHQTHIEEFLFHEESEKKLVKK